MARFLVNRWIHFTILFFLLVSAASYSYSDHDFRARLQYVTFDSFNKIHQREATDRVVIIDLDEESIRHLGQWPWPRNIMAKMVDTLTEMEAKVIAFDMVFSEPDRTSPKFVSENLPKEERFKPIKDGLAQLDDHDDIFAASIKNSNRVVTGFSQAKSEETLRKPQKRTSIIFLGKNSKNWNEMFLYNSHPLTGLVTNLASFSSVAAGNGSFVATPEEVDGIMREVALLASFPHPLIFSDKHIDDERFDNVRRYSPDLYPMLALEALRVSVDPKANYIVKSRKKSSELDTDYELTIGKMAIPIDPDSKMWVHYRDIGEDEYISAYKLLERKFQEELKGKIKGKIVFVGTSAEGLRDIRSTPLDVFIPGVEVHVNVVEQILQGAFLLRPSIISDAEASAILIFGLMIILVAPFVGVFALTFVCFSAILAAFTGSLYAYRELGLLFDPVYPALCIIAIFFVSSLLTYLRTESERKQVREAFGLYISPDFMEELTKDPDKLKLGGETRDLTVMFSDIRSFTSISETMTPAALIQLMNDFLTPMSDLVMENRGTIDKYMGDAMMAFWNAPLDDEKHAQHACTAALQMNKALEPINEELTRKAQEEGRTPLLLEAGIGINTGRASVGNMGSKQRFAYSALGDTVNLSSRLEGQTKQYGVRILVGEETRKQAPEFCMLELDLIRVKGKREPERIFVLLGDEEMAQSDYFIEWEAKHNEMLAAYRAKEWDKARRLADECQRTAGDGMTMFYYMFIDRLTEMKKSPPPADWDGVFVATTK